METTIPCEVPSIPAPFTPAVLWQYNGELPYEHVIITPLVVDVNADGTPDVVATFFNNPITGAVLRALDGRTGTRLWESAETDISYAAQLAAGDLNGDGHVTILATTRFSTLVAHSGETGARLWTAHGPSGAALTMYNTRFGGPAIVNLDGTGPSEVVLGLRAFDATGLVLWDYGNGEGVYGPLTIAADLDGDGLPEVTDGKSCVHGDGYFCGWTGRGFGGLPAAADFLDAKGQPGQDGRPELVVVNSGMLGLVDGRTGVVKVPPINLPGVMGTVCRLGASYPGVGGPPTVADFDGDGQPEVGVAGNCYSVFKLQATDAGPRWSLLWSQKVQDNTSSGTGSSVFDFDGDGRAEVIYADENTLHVFNGLDGTPLMSLPHCSGTGYEYPVVVDVEGDGHANIIVPENNYGINQFGCTADAMAGIVAYRDEFDLWAPTRPIWNQYSYHVTNVCDGKDLVCGGAGAPANGYAQIPLTEPPNWSFTNEPAGSNAKPLNNYRQNNPIRGVVKGEKAPDVRPREVSADSSSCPEMLVLKARVGNWGEVATNPGLNVAFFESGTNVPLAVATVMDPIDPGSIVEVTANWRPPAGQTWPLEIYVVVDSNAHRVQSERECDESNNVSTPISVSCD